MGFRGVIRSRCMRQTQEHPVVVNRVQLAKTAQEMILRLDKPTRGRIRERIEQLAADPYGQRISKQLADLLGMRSSRVGVWKILY